MDEIKAMKFVQKQIEELEKSIFTFENVLLPRYEADRKLTMELKAKYVKLKAFKEKKDRGEEITNEDVYEGIPASLR
jgi:hypothetical protein